MAEKMNLAEIKAPLKTENIEQCIKYTRLNVTGMRKWLMTIVLDATDELVALREERDYRHKAMCYFATFLDNYQHVGKDNVIGDIVGFWDIARERAEENSGFVVPAGDLFHDWAKKAALGQGVNIISERP